MAMARPFRLLEAGLIAGVGSLLVSTALGALQPDPFASNNTLYPTAKEWNRPFRDSNYDYPATAVASRWRSAGLAGRLTQESAPAYVAAVKDFIAKDMAGLVNAPLAWSPQMAGWYDMPWGGQGTPLANGAIDPGSGREALLGSYTGQVLQPDSYPSLPPKRASQNHAVVYYNDVAGHQLGKIWKNPYQPDLGAAHFPEGSMVVKVEAVTLSEEDWPVLKGSSVSYVYRPPVAALDKRADSRAARPVVTPMRFLQMAVRVKDKLASPDTGWVFIAFAYDSRSRGATVWDRTVPVGATWGNDPAQARFAGGLAPGGRLQETWVAADLPAFITDGLGWGGRLAGPLDLGIRHNVVTVSGQRFGKVAAQRRASLASSSCISCHGAAQYPFVANLYPSPNMLFPEEGKQFLLFDPGSPQWARWFQNRAGNVAMSGGGRDGIVATDYDMMLTFALMQANGSAGTNAFIRHRAAGH
jgi:hypothetical protein